MYEPNPGSSVAKDRLSFDALTMVVVDLVIGRKGSPICGGDLSVLSV